ncbi:MAG: hypothetical protein HY300_15540 [Verrucomicrobia bacterium]|nr:hypothetical protein [Verrucomicrobiota bacterium]
MKRLSFALVLAASLAGIAPRISAQDAAVEERLRRLEKSLENTQAENFKLRQDMATLNTRLEKVIEAAEMTARRAGNNEDIAKLAQQLKELDQRRIADQKNLVADVERIVQQMLKTMPAPPPTTGNGNGGSKSKGKNESRGNSKSTQVTPPDADGSTAPAEKGVWHTVEKGQTLGEIIKAYNDDLKSKGKSGKITLKAVEDANPKVKPDRLIVGTKVFIPIPDK